MKIRDISLMATGAIISVAVIVFASTFFNPTKSQAQGAGSIQSPGGVSMIVTAGTQPCSGGGNICQGGVITLQDSVTRKVTIVSYSYNIWSSSTSATTPNILLSTNASFTY